MQKSIRDRVVARALLYSRVRRIEESAESIIYTLFKCGDAFDISITAKYDDGSTEQAYIPDIARERESALKIFGEIERGTVTPACAIEIMEDLIEVYPV